METCEPCVTIIQLNCFLNCYCICCSLLFSCLLCSKYTSPVQILLEAANQGSNISHSAVIKRPSCPSSWIKVFHRLTAHHLHYDPVHLAVLTFNNHCTKSQLWHVIQAPFRWVLEPVKIIYTVRENKYWIPCWFSKFAPAQRNGQSTVFMVSLC